jgi:hypothetical protein
MVAEASTDYHRLFELKFVIVGLKRLHWGWVLIDHLVVWPAILEVIIEFLVIILCI